MRILIVDDNEDGRMILKSTLTAAGHQVWEAENGKEALTLARQKRPDLIISDILMPEMDGFQFCREVRKDEKLNQIPFVFYTATYTEDKDEKLALELGADRFIRKPLDGDGFLAAIKGVTRDAANGDIQASESALDHDTDFLRQYNARLIEKLEKKMVELEQENLARMEAESRLAELLAAIPDMIFRLDKNGRFLDFKPSASVELLVPPDQFLGRTADEVLPPDLARLTMENMNKAFTEETIIGYEYSLSINNRMRDYEARLIPLGKSQVVAIIRDVTLENETRKRLAESEASYRALVDSSTDHIFMFDREGIYLNSNPQCVNCDQENAPSIVGKHLRDYHEPDVTREYLGYLKQVLTSGHSVSFEHRMKSTDGIRYHLDTLYPIERDGEIWAVGGICRDITDQKKAEESLRASEEKFRELFENSPDAISIATIEGQILDANKAFFKIFGYTADEVRNLNAASLFVEPGDRKNLIAEILDKGFVINWESKRCKKDGTLKICLTSAVARRDSDGKIFAIQSITRDVTEQHRLEDQFRQSQKMESVGHLAGGVAHDFNNMLSIITGYAELARDKLSDSDPLIDDLNEILNASQRSADLVRRLLAFARQQTISPQALDLNTIIHDSVNMLTRLIGEDIEMKFIPGKDLWPVKMDPAQISQILTNLSVNARDAINGTGKLSIETANTVLDEQYCRLYHEFRPGEYVVLTVSDTGPGMTKEIRDNIFEPFFTTKAEGAGTGLGLSTVYGIIRQNNGFITVYSEPGMGTTFKIFLPRHIGEIKPPRSKIEEQTTTGHETILVVEDEEMILKLCNAALNRLGYTVLSAEAPGEAILLCEKHSGPIDLLITDVVMPTMNGKELKSRIASIQPGIRVLFMSGYTSDIIAHRGVLEEDVHFIQKPFSIDELARKVRVALND